MMLMIFLFVFIMDDFEWFIPRLVAVFLFVVVVGYVLLFWFLFLFVFLVE